MSRAAVVNEEESKKGTRGAESPGRMTRAISYPGPVKINVEGAFIVDEDSDVANAAFDEGVHYENKDIRLPYHTGVVSHVAVDVSIQVWFSWCRVLIMQIDWRLSGQAGLLFP